MNNLKFYCTSPTNQGINRSLMTEELSEVEEVLDIEIDSIFYDPDQHVHDIEEADEVIIFYKFDGSLRTKKDFVIPNITTGVLNTIRVRTRIDKDVLFVDYHTGTVYEVYCINNSDITIHHLCESLEDLTRSEYSNHIKLKSTVEKSDSTEVLKYKKPEEKVKDTSDSYKIKYSGKSLLLLA